MTPAETLQQHQQLCDELYQLALEENRFLKQNQRMPDAALLDRKRLLLGRLDASLAALKAANLSAGTTVGEPAAPAARANRAAVEKARARIMQILHLDRENEQLLFRYSLGGGPRPAESTPPPSQIQRIYERYS
ncbi:MAG TPA: hypothetical protein VMC06_09510 [Opitutaceae bacterium]|nr:hypothetical protein [Opitutaceae bacterium]